jgi:hypothetical protein
VGQFYFCEIVFVHVCFCFLCDLFETSIVTTSIKSPKGLIITPPVAGICPISGPVNQLNSCAINWNGVMLNLYYITEEPDNHPTCCRDMPHRLDFSGKAGMPDCLAHKSTQTSAILLVPSLSHDAHFPTRLRCISDWKHSSLRTHEKSKFHHPSRPRPSRPRPWPDLISPDN